jgi:hypothetical protein
MGKVYITNEPHRVENGVTRSLFDLTPAAEYGELVVLLPAGASLISTVPMVRSMRDKLANFSDDDYLLPVGDPASIMAAGAIAAEINSGRVKLLRWDKHLRRYIPIQIDVHGRSI